MAIEPRSYGEAVSWEPDRPRLRPLRVLAGWIVAAVSLAVAAWVLPGFALDTTGAAFAAAAAIAVLNAVLPPILAALRLPFMVAVGFLLVLFADAWLLMLAADLLPHDIVVGNFGDALLAALLMAAVSLCLQVVIGTDDDSEYAMRVTQRIARRQGGQVRTDVPGIIYLEIDGLALPVLRDAMRDGNAPTMARWIAEGGYRLLEWETDLSSQTGASQAGILLGSNHDIPAFRWVEKATGRVIACSSPSDCAEIEQRLASGIGLLTDGGASRGNLLSGEAAETILTVSRTDAEKRANPGYRAFLANGFNVTRTLVLFLWEVVLEVTSALRAARRDVRPRGHRAGIYPLLRAAMCVFIRDLIVFAVLTDMMRGRPAIYATFSSYDEVAHHSGLQRADTLEALRKLDQQVGRIARARRFAPPGPRRGAGWTGGRAGRPAPAASRRARTRSSCCPITGRRRARRSSSATATGWRSSCGARWPPRACWASPAAMSSTRWCATPPRRRRATSPRSSPRARSQAALTSSCWAPATWASSISWRSRGA